MEHGPSGASSAFIAASDAGCSIEGPTVAATRGGVPLVVDLDGTVVRSDLLIETALLFVRDQPHRLLSLLLWLLRGRATLRRKLAHEAAIDVAVLPYDAAVIEFIKRERGRGRPVVLTTASDLRLAQRVATHLGVFDAVMAPDSERSLSPAGKRDALIATFGARGFDYAGNASDDIPIWRAARDAYVVNATPAVERRAQTGGNVVGVIGSTAPVVRHWTHALRLHQWLKNLLVFVPLLAAHLSDQWPRVVDVVVAFLAFGLCASSVYILNDLLDLPDDRRHSRKRARPFAAGCLSIRSGLAAAPLLLGAAFLLAASRLHAVFALVLGGYYALTLAYSLALKRRMVIDVIALATLYTLRVLAGAAALALWPSFWLLAFSMFIFLSLALVKRYAELHQIRTYSIQGQARGRGYNAEDLPMIAALGAASGYLTVLVLALYINDSRTVVLYERPEFIWLACPLLLTWISRVWMLAHRGQMSEDPVLFAITDRISLAIGALTAAVFFLAAA